MGQTISQFGSYIGGTALAFTAVLFLKATPFQMALLGIAELLPKFLTGLIAGVWVDRLRRRPLLIAADVGRAVLLLTIPLAAFFSVLRMEQLYLVAFLVGILAILFDIAYEAHLPTLVASEELIEGNSKLTATASIAEFTGFGLAGWLVQWLSGPIAILMDALSFLASALFLRRIRTPEPPPRPHEDRENIWREGAAGLRTVWENPVLRAMGACIVTMDFSGRIIGTQYMVYMAGELGFRPGVLGMIFGVGGVTSLLGALFAGRIAGRIGIGPAMILGVVFTGLGALFLPFAPGATLVGALCLIANQIVTDPAATVYEINQTSLRQAMTPPHLLGRVNASLRFAGLGAMLLGGLAGGVLGETIGVRPALFLAASGITLAALWLLASPLRHLRVAPLVEDAAVPR
jgi:MFS family permease